MLKSINISGIYVLDQDKAKEFYCDTLGLEERQDLDLGFMRWLTVGVPGDPDRSILLELPGPPAMAEGTAEQVRELVTKGAMGFSAGFTTDSAEKTYEALKSRGVEVSDELTEHFYGKDFGIRDPFGNRIRIVEPAQVWGEPELEAPAEPVVK